MNDSQQNNECVGRVGVRIAWRGADGSVFVANVWMSVALILRIGTLALLVGL